MPRIGTLLGLAGRPEAQVQIMRQGAKNTRVRQQVSIGHRAVWDTEDTIVPSQWVLDDGGALWDKHRENPKGATWLSVHGQPQGRLLIHQVYKTVVKAKLHLGDDTWSHVEGFQPDAVLFDGGLRWGLRPPLGADQGDAEQHACDTEQPAVSQVESKRVLTGQRVSYIRVSSVDQNLARQRDAIGRVDQEFLDRLSARSRSGRPGLEQCIAYLRGGDQLMVASIDRLARSLVDLRQVIDQITDKGASVHFLKENLTFSPQQSDLRSVLMLDILGSFADFERSIIRERQAEGIPLAIKGR